MLVQRLSSQIIATIAMKANPPDMTYNVFSGTLNPTQLNSMQRRRNNIYTIAVREQSMNLE